MKSYFFCLQLVTVIPPFFSDSTDSILTNKAQQK